MWNDIKAWLKSPSGRGTLRGLYLGLGMAALSFFLQLPQDLGWRFMVANMGLAFLGPLGFGSGVGTFIDGRNPIQKEADKAKAAS